MQTERYRPLSKLEVSCKSKRFSRRELRGPNGDSHRDVNQLFIAASARESHQAQEANASLKNSKAQKFKPIRPDPTADNLSYLSFRRSIIVKIQNQKQKKK
ncbi:hypothetical protein PGT21_029049 [Puccinia graminis f. sp. tritici]|uniref:Uncharacterized protein n=1 Tax=Puccinia graminis f. sp. tritici TaxID=56615 RepID=A0A5B0P2Q1_PUCGR|nr:hypothetical protein PGT21_029049 [Puccinia graminis f. sp. tritici]KAA1121564.1 hypothetical protein PGTUg99_032323 [Puccinia graminis f. sp. tritici]